MIFCVNAGSPENSKLCLGVIQNVPPDENMAQWINPGPAPLIDPLVSQINKICLI